MGSLVLQIRDQLPVRRLLNGSFVTLQRLANSWSPEIVRVLKLAFNADSGRRRPAARAGVGIFVILRRADGSWAAQVTSAHRSVSHPIALRAAATGIAVHIFRMRRGANQQPDHPSSG